MSRQTRSGTVPLLEANGVSVQFGGVRALQDVTMVVWPGTVHGLVGPNGSGKTTMINCISGFVRTTSGTIKLKGMDVSEHSAPRRARAGLARTFQHPLCFEELDAYVNVTIGAHQNDKIDWCRALIPGASRGRKRDLDHRVDAALRHLGVGAHEREIPASRLPYGTRRRIDAARAIVRHPELILFDEPAAGLGGEEIADMSRTIRWLVDQGMAVLITDHNMDFMMSICDVLTVFDFGEKIAEGSPSEIRSNPRVVEAYLGRNRRQSATATSITVREAVDGDSRDFPRSRLGVPDVEGNGRAEGGRLAVTDVFAGYGSGPVLRGISLALEAGQIRAIVGANGAGKSTTLLTMSGILSIQSGSIVLDGTSISDMSPAERVRRGIAHVPEGRRVLSGLTVSENLAMGAYTVRNRRVVAGRLQDVYDLLPILEQRSKQLAGSLSGGEQQMLAIARALMSGPKVLLLDEPTMGLAPIVVDRLLDLAKELSGRGLAIGLVEQNASVALGVADFAYVIRNGQLVASGTPLEIEDSDAIRQAYLGSDN